MPDVISFNRWSLFLSIISTVALLMVARLNILMREETFITIILTVLSILIVFYFDGRERNIFLDRVIGGLEGIVFLAAVCLAFGVSTYSILSFTSGWSDAQLIKIDAMLGFDWAQLFLVVQAYPFLCSMIEFAYGSIAFQSTIIIACLAILGRIDHINRLVAATIITLFFTVILVYFVPAKSAAISFFGEGHPGLTLSSSAHVPIIRDLRDGIHPPIDLNNLVGLVTFPSFHASASLLYAWAAAPIRWLRMPMIVLNALMLFSSLLLGGHYLVDVIGGSLIALLAIWISKVMPHKPLEIGSKLSERPSLEASELLPENAC